MNKPRPLSERLHRHLQAKLQAAAKGGQQPQLPGVSCDPALMRPSAKAPRASPRFDGMSADGEDLDAYFALRGWDRSAVTFAPASPRQANPQLRAIERRLAAEARARAAVREAQLAAGRIDGRTAPAEQVHERLRQLGVVSGGYAAPAEFRDPGRPLPAPDREGGSEAALRARAQAEVDNAAALARQAGTRLDPRRLSATAYAEWRRQRGFDPDRWDVDVGARESWT